MTVNVNISTLSERRLCVTSYIKVECKGVYITRTCLHDDLGFLD